MKDILTVGQMLAAQAQLQPGRIGVRDLEREMTFEVWNRRANRLANALTGLGIGKGDRVAVLAYNCIEWAEIYSAAAKAGIVAVPINFRLTGGEAQYIITDADVSALIVQDQLAGLVEGIAADLPFGEDRIIHFGSARCPAGWRDFEGLIADASDAAPGTAVAPDDPWALMYTSGTTGHPKGAIRSHRGSAMLALVSAIEFKLTQADNALLVMPMCHANSLYFYGIFSYCGAETSIYSRANFDAEHALRTLGEGATFTSLVPTHYIMMLGLSDQIRNSVPRDRISKLLVSSAPARAETKRAVMEMFPNSGLYELYGSSEAGWVTVLHPHEQFSKLGTVGRECIGSAPIRILDETGNELPDGETGELYSSNPYTFDGYWNLPDKTAEAFRGDYCTVGDMARRDEDGYICLVDRKKNMIISGGENVYPTEVEGVLGAHEMVKDVAVIGVPDEKWGERVHAVVVLHAGAEASEAELLEWCKDRIAGYKRPRSLTFMAEDDMPRTATGKILHRELRLQYTVK